MHSKTMDIQEFPSALVAQEAGYDIPLTPAQADHLKDMNREQRRAWAKAERKLGKLKGAI